MKTQFEQSDIKAIAQEVARILQPMLNCTKQLEDNALFTVDTLAKYLGVSKQWVYEKVHLNDIPHYKVGKYPRFSKVKIEEWLTKREKGTNKKSFISC